MGGRNNKGRLAPFVPMIKTTIGAPAWRACSHGARSLYLLLKSGYNNRLQNGVYLSTRKAAKQLGSFSNKDIVGRWFRELQHYGLIVMVSGACLGIEGKGKAPHYRLTEEWYLGKPPTRDFTDWNGEKFQEQKSPSHYRRRDYIAHQKRYVTG